MKTRSRSLSVSFINRNEQIIPFNKLDYYSPPISLVDGVNFRSKSVIMCRLLFQCKAMVAVRLFCLPLYLSGVRLATPIWWMANIHQLRRLISAKEKKTHTHTATKQSRCILLSIRIDVIAGATFSMSLLPDVCYCWCFFVRPFHTIQNRARSNRWIEAN